MDATLLAWQEQQAKTSAAGSLESFALNHLSGSFASVLAHASCPFFVPSLPDRSLSAAAKVLDAAILGDIRSLIGQGKLEYLLDLLADELEERPRALRDALADRQFDQASAVAHSLIGAAGHLGATDVADAARLLQLAIADAQEGCLEALAPALRHFARAISEAQQALAALPRAREAAFATWIGHSGINSAFLDPDGGAPRNTVQATARTPFQGLRRPL